jgi:hypothetical protein
MGSRSNSRCERRTAVPSREPNSPRGHARFEPAVLGFRVKSGWATAVLIARSTELPQVLDRRVVDLSDPADPESRQPYHAQMGMLETDEAKVQRRREVVFRAANGSVPQLIEEYQCAGRTILGAALVVGSQIDPAKITNPHIRAHALEGRLFRTALEEAIRSCKLPCTAIAERDLYGRAAAVLKRSEQELKRLVASLGRSLGGPWRADEKTACLAAWLALLPSEG